MKASARDSAKIICYNCQQSWHKNAECKNSTKTPVDLSGRWCHNCKSRTHDTKFCRKWNGNSSKSLSEVNDTDGQDQTFAFAVRNEERNKSANSLLVDCGAMVHIINDEDKFIRFDENFNASSHIIELADGSTTSGIVSGRGDANVLINNVSG